MKKNQIVDTQDYFTAKKRLNEFLEANPHLKPLQAEIELVLKKAGPNIDNKLVAFKKLAREWLSKSANDLNQHASELRSTVNKIQNISKKDEGFVE